MAQNITVILTDDLDGSEATETVRFGLDGIGYEIDLNGGNAEKLREILGEWIGHARRAGGNGIARSLGGGGGSRGRKKVNPGNAVIRAWAADNGHEIGGHGRIPAHVRALYEVELREKRNHGEQ
jgi:hypothetical protein